MTKGFSLNRLNGYGFVTYMVQLVLIFDRNGRGMRAREVTNRNQVSEKDWQTTGCDGGRTDQNWSNRPTTDRSRRSLHVDGLRRYAHQPNTSHGSK